MIPGSNREHPTFLRSFRYALEGFRTAVTTGRNINVQICVGVAALIAGSVLKLDALSWILIILCIGLVLFAELVNTSIEAIVDLATQELHPLAKRAKDIAAASVFTLSVTSAIVGIIVFVRAFTLL
ncbi:diacylglycerol kinase family protein [Collinsella sp. An307]|uniref:diacylglycerol kinase family protein n=1 Tax=Collinsella sp. An307 TaxID=1965630 RepID=UPI000B36C97C|nr:diacylglycerol kinase family protein [Collinsella sp. An307]OUO19754.1 diacylglycerol kinase [Collinsella sp. An307]